MLVLDANVALSACVEPSGFERFSGESLVAPPLMWSEARATLHLTAWRGDATPEHATEMLERIENAPIDRRDHERLGYEAWRIADELGWARTYDAEYVALAGLLGCRLVTLDARLRRAADRLGFVVAPSEL